MTTASQPPAPGCARPIVTDTSSVSNFIGGRPITPPPYRLNFEPIAMNPFTAKRRNNTNDSNCSKNGATESLHQESLNPKITSQAFTHTDSQYPAKVALTVTPEVASTCHELPGDASYVRGVVYMFHGWAQNVYVFSNRARKLTKRLNKAGYRVVFLQGPHRLPAVEPTSASADSTNFTEERSPQRNGRDGGSKSTSSFSREYAYAWFFYDDPSGGDKNSNRDSNNSQPPVLQPSPTGDFPGMDSSLLFLRNELRADQIEFCKTRTASNQNAVKAGIPPVFLLGFSQGAVLVHKLATMACGSDSSDDCEFPGVPDIDNFRRHMGDPWNDIQKCILVSGFSFTTSLRRNDETDIHKSSGEDDHRAEIIECSGSTSRRRTIPSFHVMGRKDSRVSPHLTLELYSLEPCFGQNDSCQKILWEHDRGHVLPQDRAFCDRLLEFLAEP